MNIDEKILVNQIAQDVVDIEQGERWFASLGESERRDVLRELNFMIVNAGPRNEDIANAIARSGLTETFTPCVLLKTGEVRTQLARIANLPQNELLKAFRLLITLLSVTDGRRWRETPVDTENHWWHRDLRDPEVIARIKEEFGS